MMDCVFCQIVKGVISAHKIYEDDHVIVILDHKPIRPGHSMVIPKQHIEYFFDLPDHLASHIVLTGNKLAKHMMKTLTPTPLCIGHVVHGFIPHVHYHIIPQYDWNDIASARYAKLEDKEIIFDANMIPTADDSSQRLLANKLKIECCPQDTGQPGHNL